MMSSREGRKKETAVALRSQDRHSELELTCKCCFLGQQWHICLKSVRPQLQAWSPRKM